MAKLFYDELKADRNYRDRLDNFLPEKIRNLDFINRNLSWKVRDYQEKAIYMLQYFQELGNEDYFKKKLIEELDGHKIAFYSFEMATGAGKTLIMAANILALFKQGYHDFLVITPNTPIYEKTIRNFTLSDRRCVFSDDTSLKFNLVTGDTYKDKTCHFDETADINIYVFNIQKFFERNTDKQDESKGVAYTHRPLEESYWRDDRQNTISFIEFLRKRKLITITDEAHHYRTAKSADVIRDLLPDMVLEYTATSIEEDSTRKEQKVIYKYGLKDLIKDKYAKKIRALGYKDLEEKPTNQVTDADKKKIVLSLLCHIVKREALKPNKQKPIMLIRTRQVEHSINVLNYIQTELIEDKDIIGDVLTLTETEQAPVVKLFRKYYESIKYNQDKLLKELEKICKNSFRIDSENKNDSEIIDQWDNIEDNEYEIVVYVRMLDEGIDINNIYLLTILSDNDSAIKTNVKQAIGRGVRLFKESRQYDDLPDPMKRQTENLYIICDKNKNFEKFIELIRTELELNREELGSDVEETEIEDTPDTPKIKDIQISTMEIFYDERDTPESQVTVVLDKSLTKVNEYIGTIAFDENGKNMLRREIEAILDERDATSSETQQTLTQHITEDKKIVFNESEIDRLVSDFIEEHNFLPDHEQIRIKTRKIIEKILDKGVYFKWTPGYDVNVPKRIIMKTFIEYFGHYISGSIYEVKSKIVKKKLTDLFHPRTIMFEDDSYHNHEEYDAIQLGIPEDHIYFSGFKYSLYKYNIFDSSQERKLAIILDKVMDKTGNKGNFWIKNGRRSEFTLKGTKHEYNPDFLVFYEGKIYIIEVKGTGLYYLDFVNKGNRDALIRLGEESKDITPVLLMSTDIDQKMVGKVETMKGILDNNSLKRDKPLETS